VSKTFSRGCILLLGLLAKPVAAKEMPKNQPPVCSSRPNIAAFEKMENDRLTAAQGAIDQICWLATPHALPSAGAGAGRIVVSQRPGEEFPWASAEHGGLPKVDGRGV
jgi:hypothetical protein